MRIYNRNRGRGTAARRELLRGPAGTWVWDWIGLGGRSRFVPRPGAKLATGTAISDRPGGAYDGLIAFDACMHMLSVPIRRQRAVTNQIEVSAVRMLITRPNYCTVVLD